MRRASCENVRDPAACAAEGLVSGQKVFHRLSYAFDWNITLDNLLSRIMESLSLLRLVGSSWTSLAAWTMSVTSLWYISVIVYRLYLSPIAKFPGPKLAAATGWYECYYDVFKPGLYIYEIEKMHAKYG